MPEATPHDCLTATRQAYDDAAGTYARLFRGSLRDSPLDRAMLGVFVEAVRAGGGGRVGDLGCGPGHVTAYLAELGMRKDDVFGVDASTAMVGLAQQAYPDIQFAVGTMGALDLPDGALAGVLSRWSIIHTPPTELPVIVAGFARVLTPGGHLLLGFSASDGAAEPVQVFDHAVAPAYRWWPDRLAALLCEHGLLEVARMVREPLPTDRRPFKEVHLLARRADTPTP
ncbi:class I SAM-dependent methyltransferase [Streptomyces sp. NPDC006704]|uniref:class I SAM-dependent methyltransferase n=1 Tax=Streptomyces sp. NPDC006704 TaxID=3364760 RepID=UPI0036A4B4CF